MKLAYKTLQLLNNGEPVTKIDYLKDLGSEEKTLEFLKQEMEYGDSGELVLLMIMTLKKHQVLKEMMMEIRLIQIVQLMEIKEIQQKDFKQGDFVKLFGQLRTSIDDNGNEHTNLRILSFKLLKAKKKMKNKEEKKESSKETER